MNKQTVKERVWDLLQKAHECKRMGNIAFTFDGRAVPCRDGWLPQSIFANPEITGSTEGKRRIRELRAEHSDEWIFELKHEHKRWYYRIIRRPVPRTRTRQNRLMFAAQ